MSKEMVSMGVVCLSQIDTFSLMKQSSESGLVFYLLNSCGGTSEHHKSYNYSQKSYTYIWLCMMPGSCSAGLLSAVLLLILCMTFPVCCCAQGYHAQKACRMAHLFLCLQGVGSLTYGVSTGVVRENFWNGTTEFWCAFCKYWMKAGISLCNYCWSKSHQSSECRFIMQICTEYCYSLCAPPCAKEWPTSNATKLCALGWPLHGGISQL